MPHSVVFTQPQIQDAVRKVAGEVSSWLKAGKIPVLNLVSVLEGAKPFARDLSQNLKQLLPELRIQLQEVRSKGTRGKTLLSGRDWAEDSLDLGAIGKHPVLVVDDLADSGATLRTLKEGIAGLGAGEVKTAVLIRKFGGQSGPVDFLGFDLNLDRTELAKKGLRDYWLFGYGMDDDGKYRDLDHVGWIEVG